MVKKKDKRKKRRRIIIVVVSLVLVSIILSFLVIALIESKPLCGNGRCDIIENWKTCPIDCKRPPGAIWKIVCDDGICEYPEDRTTCPADCGIQTTECGDGICEVPEDRTNCLEDCEISAWSVDYKKEMIANGIPNNYLQRTVDFDYDARNIQELIYEIRSNSISAKGAVKRTAREVYSRIEYVLLPGMDCITNTASEVLAREYGLCSTMSKVNIAILRGMGIAARPVVGCASIFNFCKPLTILPGDPLPKIGKIRMEGDGAIVGGGLHAWVEVWLPEEGWVLLESTNGIVYENPRCTRYDTLTLDPPMRNFCMVYDRSYIASCKDDSLFE